MTEKKKDNGHTGGTMIKLGEYTEAVEDHRRRMAAATPGTNPTTKEAIMNLIHCALNAAELGEPMGSVDA